jgi:hypothetical protein
MRAKEFIIESTEATISNPDKLDRQGKTLAQVKKAGKQTHPAKSYKAGSFKSGKLGVPHDGAPHDTHSRHQDNQEYGSKRGEVSDEAAAAMPGAFSVETLPSDFYGVYRLGMGLAAGDRNVAAADNIGKHPFFMPFAPEEHARFDKEIKRQGHKTKLRTTHDSQELSTVNQTSPVAQKPRNKYGV